MHETSEGLIMANCYFIDFENVHNTGLKELSGLNADDLIYIFYTGNSENITLDNVNLLNKTRCSYELIKVPAGSQSLDMHLISFAGYTLGVNGKKYTYVVISKDKDYDNIISFWNKRCGVSIKRAETINTKAQDKKQVTEAAQKPTAVPLPAVKENVPTVQAPAAKENTPTVQAPAAKENTPTVQASAAKENTPTVQASAAKENTPSVQASAAKENTVAVRVPVMSSKIANIPEITSVMKNSGYPDDLINKTNTIVVACAGGEMPLSSIHFNLKNETEKFAELYKLIKPAAQKYIKSLNKGDTNVSSSPKSPLNEKVKKVLRDHNFSKTASNKAATIICGLSTRKDAKMQIYRQLVSEYGQEKGLSIYRTVKSLL